MNHKASRFDLQAAVKGCTFDDVLFSPKLCVLERRDPSRIDLSCPLTARITLARPFLSANMDTVTRAPRSSAAVVRETLIRRLAGDADLRG